VLLVFNVLLVALVPHIAVPQIAVAQNWARFRGTNGDGISAAKTVPTEWTEKDYNWVVELPGGGHSSPVVWGDKIFLTSADEKSYTRYLICISTTDGKELWEQEYPFSKFKRHKGNSFATNTPCADEKHVYVLWQSAEQSTLHALDHDGNPVWKFDMGTYKSGHGTGSSPIVYKDKVIVCNDHDGENSFLIALNATDGEEIWRIPRPGDRACYSTPCVFETKGRDPELIFTHSFQGISGVNPDTGEQNWIIDVFGRHPQRAVASPVTYGDLVIGSSGFTTAEKNFVAVRPTDSGTDSTVKEIYRLNKTVPHIPSPIIYNGRMFLWTDTGICVCVNAVDGESIWQKRVGGNFFGSPVCVDGKMYCVDVDGVVNIVAASDEYELLNKVQLGETCRSTPAVANGVLYIRTFSHLYSLGGGK
ncbi:MAG: outer membrane protein assembly factor BamB, partial [Pirellulaceae bacterium]